MISQIVKTTLMIKIAIVIIESTIVVNKDNKNNIYNNNHDNNKWNNNSNI